MNAYGKCCKVDVVKKVPLQSPLWRLKWPRQFSWFMPRILWRYQLSEILFTKPVGIRTWSSLTVTDSCHNHKTTALHSVSNVKRSNYLLSMHCCFIIVNHCVVGYVTVSLLGPSNSQEFPQVCTSMFVYDIADVFQCFQYSSCHLRLVLHEVLQDCLWCDFQRQL